MEDAKDAEKSRAEAEAKGKEGAEMIDDFIDKMQPHVPVLQRVKVAPALHELFCTFFRATANRITVVGGLPGMVINTGYIRTSVPPNFGGFRVMKRPSVAPNHIPDVVFMEAVGGPVDIANVVYVGPGAQVSLEAAIGEDGDGVFDDWVKENRIDEARKLLPFGSSEMEEWEKEEEQIRRKKEAMKSAVSGIAPRTRSIGGHVSLLLFLLCVSVSRGQEVQGCGAA